MIRLSAFADEISADPVEQIACLKENGIRSIEFRSIYGTNVLDLSTDQHQEFRALLDSHQMTLSAIGSPIGKIPISDPFEPHLARLDRAIELALYYRTPLIRIFSFYLPEGDDPARYRDEVMRRMGEMTRAGEKQGVRFVLENERGIYGDTAPRVREIIETISSPALRHAFDPANYLEVGQDVEEAWSLLRDVTVHFHVKDFDLKSRKNVPAGQGDGRIGPLIADAVRHGFDGFCTLEPHLLIAAQSHGFTGPERFGEAARALKAELERESVAFE